MQEIRLRLMPDRITVNAGQEYLQALRSTDMEKGSDLTESVSKTEGRGRGQDLLSNADTGSQVQHEFFV